MSETWDRELELLRRRGVDVGSGLSPAELTAAETRVGATFPPDLSAFLTSALPQGKRFPNWRQLGGEALRQQLARPLEGLLFDVEHNKFWPDQWGPKPQALDAALQEVRSRFQSVPRMIPIYAHRYLPTAPCQQGNPVFSVWQTDIIFYGTNLRRYLACEFGPLSWREAVSGEVREIDFWSELAR